MPVPGDCSWLAGPTAVVWWWPLRAASGLFAVLFLGHLTSETATSSAPQPLPELLPSLLSTSKQQCGARCNVALAVWDQTGFLYPGSSYCWLGARIFSVPKERRQDRILISDTAALSQNHWSLVSQSWHRALGLSKQYNFTSVKFSSKLNMFPPPGRTHCRAKSVWLGNVYSVWMPVLSSDCCAARSPESDSSQSPTHVPLNKEQEMLPEFTLSATGI